MNKFSIQKTPKHTANELAAKFRILRNNAKLSRKELAERSGVSGSSIKRFETTGQIALISLLKIAQILHRMSDFDALFNKDETEEIAQLFSKKMNI